MMRLSITQLVIITCRSSILCVALGFLVTIAKNRLHRFTYNHIARESEKVALTEPWYEMAICFGPRLSLTTVACYKSQQQSFRNGKPFDPNNCNSRRTTNVNNMKQYEYFFQRTFNWTSDSMYYPGIRIINVIEQDWSSAALNKTFNHAFSMDVRMTTHVNYLDFHHIFCRNYTYQMVLSKSHEFVHEILLPNEQFSTLLGSGRYTHYADIFVYPKGHLSEFPLIQDIVPFRVDMSHWTRLRITAAKVIQLPNKPGKSCRTKEDHPKYSYTQCLTWCLRRALLNNINCTTPEIDGYIYNMTEIRKLFYAKEWQAVDFSHRGYSWTKEREVINNKFRSDEYFNSATVLPWMRDYIHLPLCNTLNGFKHTISMLRKAFYPKGATRYPLDVTCGTQCPPECDDFRVVIVSEGIDLKKPDRTAEVPHGFTIQYESILETIGERWVYAWQQLFIDLSGVLSFLLGLSVITIYDWCFATIDWTMQRIGAVRSPDIDLAELDFYYGDEYSYYSDEDEYYRHSYGDIRYSQDDVHSYEHSPPDKPTTVSNLLSIPELSK